MASVKRFFLEHALSCSQLGPPVWPTISASTCRIHARSTSRPARSSANTAAASIAYSAWNSRSARHGMSSSYDGIILGAGHNGMILQAYLGKAGMKVLAIDRKAVTGGGLSTVEDPRHPGFLHNTHAFFQRAITAMPWYADLELERHGAGYIEPELNVALLTRDGGLLEWWTDIERTIESFAEFSRRDADTLRRWQHEFVPIVRDILLPESRSVPLPPEERRALLQRSAAGRRLMEVSALSPLEFVHRGFEHPAVQAGLLF